MDINLALKKCKDSGIKVYPIYKDYRWYVEVSNGRKTRLIDKPLSESKVNNALVATYIHYAEKL